MKKILLILAVTFCFKAKSQNVVYLFGMDSHGQPVINYMPIPSVVNTGSYPDLTNKPVVLSLTNTGTSGASTLNTGTGVLNIPNYAPPTPYSQGTGINISSNIVTNTAPDQTVVLSGANGLSISGAYPSFTLTQYIPTITSGVTRPINSTTFTVSTTKQAFVSYNVTISCTATIGSASTGSVSLQYSTNAGSTWTTVGTVSNSNTVTLAIVLNSVQVSGMQLSGYIPANALVRMVGSTTGTTTLAYLTGQEIY